MSRVATECSLQLYGIAYRPTKTELTGLCLAIATAKVADIQFWGGSATKDAGDCVTLIEIK